MNEAEQFLFVCCQVGAERPLKAEVQADRADLRPAFSRPGFVTFKCRGEARFSDDVQLKSVLARCCGISTGQIEGDDCRSMAERFWQLVGDRGARHLHVWSRDAMLPGDHGFEPGESPLAAEVGAALLEAFPREHDSEISPPRMNRQARPGQAVLDCVLVEPGHWWVGHHRASGFASRWPGGVYEVKRPDDIVSRAYLKMAEALAWAAFPMRPGDRCVEIGSAPGGASLALLDRGMRVTGIDPAEMDEIVTRHPEFTHVRKRGRDLKRRDYSGFRWLMADSNVAPAHTLDTVQDIVTHASVNVRGMLLTLKLSDWKLLDEMPGYLERIKGWGYRHVKVRQLAHNRREVCVAALRRQSMRRERATMRRERATMRRVRVDAGQSTRETSAEAGRE